MLLKQYFVMVLLAESCHNGCVDNLKVHWKLIKSCLPTALLRKLLQEEFLCWFQHSLAVSVLKQWWQQRLSSSNTWILLLEGKKRGKTLELVMLVLLYWVLFLQLLPKIYSSWHHISTHFCKTIMESWQCRNIVYQFRQAFIVLALPVEYCVRLYCIDMNWMTVNWWIMIWESQV